MNKCSGTENDWVCSNAFETGTYATTTYGIHICYPWIFSSVLCYTRNEYNQQLIFMNYAPFDT